MANTKVKKSFAQSIVDAASPETLAALKSLRELGIVEIECQDFKMKFAMAAMFPMPDAVDTHEIDKKNAMERFKQGAKDDDADLFWST